MFSDIEISEKWDTVEPVDKGWSSDRKYRILTKEGEKQLLRISDIAHFDEKKKEYEIIGKYAKLGFPMSMPVAFGACNEGKSVYMLLTWVEGSDLEEMLPKLSKEEQYRLGRQAGEILKKIHSVPLAPEDMPKQTKKEKKLTQLARYENSDLRIPGDETALRYVKDNIDQIWRKAPVYTHGDFHPGNLIYTRSFTSWKASERRSAFRTVSGRLTRILMTMCPRIFGRLMRYMSHRRHSSPSNGQSLSGRKTSTGW